MNVLLSLLIAVPIVGILFNQELSAAAGLSVPNALLALTVLFLVLRFTISRDFVFELKGVLICFAVLVLYALVTMLVAEFVIDYPRYDLLASIVRLKNGPIDHMAYFLVFLYGARTAKDATTVLRAMLLTVALANIASVLDAFGVVDLGLQSGNIKAGDTDRAQGVMGEHNQYGAFLVLFLPALIAEACATRGAIRLFWAANAGVSIAALLITASRGALVGAFVSGLVGLFLYRRTLSIGRVAAWLAIAAVVVGALLAVLSMQYGDLLYERLIGQSKSVDAGVLSSGRSVLWLEIVVRMLRSPLSLLTGFGWSVYATMPFASAPHNEYLGLWFELGIVGVVALVLIFVQTIREARSVSQSAPAELRPHLIAFVIGTIALAVSIFFVNLFTPWPYIWAYVGLLMRLTVAAKATERSRGSSEAVVKVRSDDSAIGARRIDADSRGRVVSRKR